ncbi:unnamed protein product [Adineta steineri]|uniref:NHL repeat containing protein-like protein n=1 Tax=Adineta steineri TaxID=433720 RepID=A0A815GBS8_9BILA|nr:unnamed protein product [Adineta steineri]CAF1336339.1 unnamed protein product [Adineta steineri]
MTCTECTCAALTVGAVGWNCVTSNNTCQLITNYSASDFHWAKITNGSFRFTTFPPEPSTTTSMLTSTSTTSSSTTSTSTTSSSTTSSSTTSTSTTSSSTTSTSTTTTAFTFQWNSTGNTVAGSATGIPNATASQLSEPYILRFDSSNALYISDTINNRIQKWIIGSSNGTTVAGLASGVSGSSSNTLKLPVGFVLDSLDNMYVSDKGNNRIMYWQSGASSGSLIAGTGSTGNANNQFNEPNVIERDPSTGTLYISDVNNHRIMRYLSNASSGTVVAGGNGAGTGLNQLYSPYGFTFDSSTNSLIIANYHNHNVVHWVIGASNWTILAGSTVGTSGSSSILLNQPVGVTLDRYGNIYVADSANHRIQFYLAGQSNGTTIAGRTGLSGTLPTLLHTPYSMILDSQFNLYVADTYNNRVQKFSYYSIT